MTVLIAMTTNIAAAVFWLVMIALTFKLRDGEAIQVGPMWFLLTAVLCIGNAVFLGRML